MQRFVVGLGFNFVFLLGVCFGQVKVEKTADGRIYLGPNPSSRYELFVLAIKSPHVLEVLELGADEIEGGKELLMDLKKSESEIFDAPHFSGREKTERILEIRANADTMIEEILTPEMLGFLEKLAFRIEIDRGGIVNALCRGRLGEAVGIHPQQHDVIARKGAECEERIEEEISKIRKMYTERFLKEELAPEQAEKALELLSGTHGFAEESQGKAFFRSVRSRLETDAEEGVAKVK